MSGAPRHRAVAALASAAVFLAGGAALAEPRASDPLHGRFEGDLAIAASAGVAAGGRSPRAAADLRVRYLSTAGVFAMYEGGPLFGEAADPRRAIAFGAELRPIFLARWARGLDLGVPQLDLFIDSFALELGAVFVQPEGARLGARPGLQAGLGLELPIFPRASGPFVGFHTGIRWSDAALAGGPVSGPSDRSFFLMITLGWQQLFGGSVVDARDRAFR